MNQPKDNGATVAVINTQSLYEKHKKVYPRSITGLFANWRWAMVWFTQLIFYGTCWIEWNGRQAVLFHVIERKFYIFGLVLWPQDVLYLALLLIISACALFLVTAVGGRLFCGYVCPQTVYTEILLWIEAKVEGERPARMKLDKGPRDLRWWRLKTTKHLLWLLVALWTGFSFVGYFTPIRELVAAVPTLSFGPWEWFWILFYAGFLYMQAGFLREQVCKYMCPYARFQGVMFDPDTLIISYDPERGEKRAPRKKGADYKAMGLGDCVDCGLCVQVCPTGIDIRDGLQMECIACSACIDACDQVMDKVGYPRGLIRYSTEAALEKHYTRKDIVAHLLRPRTILYTGILMAITLATVWSMATRVPLKVDVIRDRSVLSREADDGRIENLYTLHISNTGETAHRFSIAVSGLEGIDIAEDRIVEVPAASLKPVSLTIRVAPDSGKKGSNPIQFDVRAQNHDAIAASAKATFILP